MVRSKTLLLVLSCSLTACGDDASSTGDTDETTGGEDDTSTTVTPPTTTIPPTTTPPPTTSPMTSTGTDGTDGTDSTGPDTDSDSVDDSSSGDDSTTSEGSSSTGAPECGDGVANGDDACDGDDLAGSDCVMEGFDGGALACADDCTFDTSGCTTCGNATLEDGEDCEGDDLDGADCISEGFIDGTLSCAADCTFDTSGCHNCGNGVVDPDEDCDGDDLADMGCTDLGLGFTGGALACDTSCGFDTTGCTSFAAPAAGEVVITEIMQNPSVIADSDGEWFELHNPSLDTTYQLDGCTIEGSNDDGFVIEADLTVDPGGHLAFSVDADVDQGFTPDYQWPSNDFNLTNGSDRVALVCAAVTVDEVDYDGGPAFPDPSGASTNLDPDFADATSNDDGANWCEATSDYNGDLGTPGAANDECAEEVTYAIDFCRLQFPTTIDEVQGTDVDVFGRLFIDGLTDLSGVNDPAPEVIGYVGYGPDGTDPAVDGGWTWAQGAPNASYGPASPNYEANNDEYQATLTVPAAGDYDFAFRFSGDSGATFTYCDGMAEGSDDGYQTANAGQMTATSAGTPANMYFSEYIEGASFDKAIEIYNADTVAGDLDLCEVNTYFNGDVDPSAFSLSGSLAADDTFVVCHSMFSDVTNCDVLTGSASWNGNDAVELVCNGVTMDVIGQIGDDPESEWSANGVGTENEGLRRDCAVTTGDTNGTDAFDPSAEWSTHDDADFSDLGSYVCP